MDINIAVIGCGYWGKNLIRVFSELEALCCVSDSNDLLASKYSKEFDVPKKTFKEIITDRNINALVIATPPNYHCEQTVEALGAGKHVYVEKPIAMNEKQAERMIKASDESGMNLMVGHLLHYHPAFVQLQETLALGNFGKLKYIESERLSLGKVRKQEDVIWSFAPHDISMILSLMGHLPRYVSAFSSKILQQEISDIANINLDFESIRANISVSWLSPQKKQKLSLFFKDSVVIFDDMQDWDKKITIYNQKVDLGDEMPSFNKSEPIHLKINKQEPLRNECKYFLDLIKGDKPPLTDGHEGLKVLKVMNAASESIKYGKKIRISK